MASAVLKAVPKASPKEAPKWTIRCLYYNNSKQLIKTVAARYPRSAILRALDHMQMDDYNARIAEIIDQAIGTLHCVLRRSPMEVTVVYKKEAEQWRRK
jgi:hypothetical protein